MAYGDDLFYDYGITSDGESVPDFWSDSTWGGWDTMPTGWFDNLIFGVNNPGLGEGDWWDQIQPTPSPTPTQPTAALPTASSLPDTPNKGYLASIEDGIKKMMSNNLGQLATLGIGGALALMGFANQGGGKVRTPDGRTIQLSPQEQQFMDAMVRQADQISKISTPANEALAGAAQRNIGNISDFMDYGLQNLPRQQLNQNRVTEAVSGALNNPRLATVLDQDLAISDVSNRNLLNILTQAESGGGEGDVSKYWRNMVLGQGGTGVSPELLLEQEDEKAAAEARALRTGGSGYETTTWYRNQLDRLGREQGIARDNSRTARAGAATDAYNQTRTTDQNVLDAQYARSNTGVGTGAKTVAALQTIGSQGGGTGAGAFSLLTDKDPTATANTGFTGLANLGNFQAGRNLTADIFNSQQATANRNSLLQGGFGLLGYGLNRRSV
jgi:hypothetical protein